MMSAAASVNIEMGKRIIALRQAIVARFTTENWQEVGLLTGMSQIITDYPRLLRSLAWNDEDYSGNVLGVLQRIVANDPQAFVRVEQYVGEKYVDDSEYISAEPSERRISFAPNVFKVPSISVEEDLVAVMMPINAGFQPVLQSIQRACQNAGLRCLRVDSLWETSTIIQEIFNLIFRARIIVVDFTGKNPNVMYETGIAHTLGKTVVPISQAMTDLPFDLAHHRILQYLANQEGLASMEGVLSHRLRTLVP